MPGEAERAARLERVRNALAEIYGPAELRIGPPSRRVYIQRDGILVGVIDDPAAAPRPPGRLDLRAAKKAVALEVFETRASARRR